MPLVRISLLRGKPPSYRRKLGDAVHQAMVETINVPVDDRFQIVTEHDPEDFVFDREFLGIRRTRDLVMVQITLSAGRTLAQKRALYRTIAARLGSAAQLRPEDVLVSLLENTREDWSFGNGAASYAPQETVAA